MDFLFDIYQQGKITQANQQAEKAANKADRFADEIKSLEHRLNRLALATQALWEIHLDAGHQQATQMPLLRGIAWQSKPIRRALKNTQKLSKLIAAAAGRNSKGLPVFSR